MRFILSTVFLLFSLIIVHSQNVGIAVPVPIGKLHIKVNSTTDLPHLRLTENGSDFARIKMESDAHSGAFWDIAGQANGITANAKLNFYFRNATTSGDRMTITGIGDVGIGTTNPGNKLRVHGSTTSTQHVVSASVNYSGFEDIRAIEGFSTPAPGHGYGGYFVGGKYGLYGLGQGTNATGQVYGVYGLATSTSFIGTRVGVYGSASGGAKNWSGFFAGGHVFVTNDLRIGAGSQDGVPGYKVAIDGKVIAEEMRVQISTAWPDYVFNEEYDLQSLTDLEKEITQLGHLPGIPSAEEVEKDGIMVGDMNRLLLEKIEELTLHVINLQKELDEIKKNKNEE